MRGQVPDRIKREQRDRAMAEQQRVARELGAAQVGRILRVLVQGPSAEAELLIEPGQVDHWWVARGEADAADIDGRVYVRGQLGRGEFARVRITGHSDYDLFAEPERRD